MHRMRARRLDDPPRFGVDQHRGQRQHHGGHRGFGSNRAPQRVVGGSDKRRTARRDSAARMSRPITARILATNSRPYPVPPKAAQPPNWRHVWYPPLASTTA